MIKKRLSLTFGGLVLLAWGLVLSTASAEAGLATPKGAVILRVLGDIEHTNQDAAAVFDRDMIEALGMETLVTTTPWTDGEVTFEGVRATRLLEQLGEHGRHVLARALNDYTVEIPADDLEAKDLFLALKMDGRYLRVRDKGPIWAIYPFSRRPELNTPVYHNRAIWQLQQLEFN
ncbi:MAG: molybdopterin-dependent oxidoreductase [Alphaproteobacteria bacterium]